MGESCHYATTEFPVLQPTIRGPRHRIPHHCYMAEVDKVDTPLGPHTRARLLQLLAFRGGGSLRTAAVGLAERQGR